jgi:hypothetical protein
MTNEMTNEKQNKTPEPSVAGLTAALVLFFVTMSLAMGFITIHVGLLPNGLNAIDPIVAWATAD